MAGKRRRRSSRSRRRKKAKARAKNARKARDWAALPLLALHVVSKKISDVFSYINFRRVCTSWRSAAPRIRFPPLLMTLMTGEETQLRFYCLYYKQFHTLNLPQAQGKLFTWSNFGWFVLRQVKDGFSHSNTSTTLSLLNPFTRAEISLPSDLAMAPSDVILSSDPRSGDCTCLVLGIPDKFARVAFCRIGDKRWTQLMDPLEGEGKSLAHLKGRFYAVAESGAVAVYDPRPPAKARIVARLPFHKPFTRITLNVWLLATSQELLLLNRISPPIEPDTFEIFAWDYGSPLNGRDPVEIYAWDPDSETSSWSKVHSIGDYTLLLHPWFTDEFPSWFRVCQRPYMVRGFSMLKSNHIYITELGVTCRDGSSFEDWADILVVDLADGSTERVKRILRNPCWFSPSLC